MKSSKSSPPGSGGSGRKEPPSEARNLRKTGIHVASEMPWGSHLCIFYETMNDLMSTAASYFRAGLEAGELCLWMISEPLERKQVAATLEKAIPNFMAYLLRGQMQILDYSEFCKNGEDSSQRKLNTHWRGKLDEALAQGYQGLRVSCNAYWMAANHWDRHLAHECNRALKHQRMMVLSTYSLHARCVADLLEITRAHHCTITKRKGRCQLLNTPHSSQPNLRPANANEVAANLPKSFSPVEPLTTRESTILAQLRKGATSKEVGRNLGISPRTVEFHRANIIKKLNAKNIVDVVSRIPHERKDTGDDVPPKK